jgi:hypothetical protein
MPERRKWNLFFERHGCLVCVTRERIHVANGMCARCYSRTHSTLKQIIAEQTTGEQALASSCALLPTSVEQPKTISGNSTLAASRILPRTLVGNGARVPRGWKRPVSEDQTEVNRVVVRHKSPRVSVLLNIETIGGSQDFAGFGGGHARVGCEVVKMLEALRRAPGRQVLPAQFAETFLKADETVAGLGMA